MRWLSPKIRNALRRFFFYLLLLLFFLHPGGKLGSGMRENQPLETPPHYLWPTNAGRLLASTFAETRSQHFHFGIDIRTQQKVGFPCFAVADGYVARLKVSPHGYGRALYLQLKDGRMAVYGHLQRFAPAVERVIHAQQMRQKSFRCEMFFEPGDLPFKQGDIVAYSGDSGVGFPHLHFEIRDAAGYLNPFLFGLSVDDRRPPVPQKMALFPLAYESEIDRDFRPWFAALTRTEMGNYAVKAIPEVFGPVGLGVEGYDQMDGGDNQVGLYKLELYLDDSLCFSARYDGFKFEESKQVELDCDYRQFQADGEVFHRLWKDSANTVNIYAGEGLLDSRSYAPGRHRYEIVLGDYAGNASRVSGQIDFRANSIYPRAAESGTDFGEDSLLPAQRPEGSLQPANAEIEAEFYDHYVVFSLPQEKNPEHITLFLRAPFQAQIPLVQIGDRLTGKLRLNALPAGDLKVEILRQTPAGDSSAAVSSWYVQPIPAQGGSALSADGLFQAAFDAGALYRPLYARIEAEDAAATSSLCSRVYRLEPLDVPLKGSAKVSIQIAAGETQPEKLGLYGQTPGGRWRFLDNDRSQVKGSISAGSTRMQSFALRRDVTPPALEWLSPSATTSDRRPTLRLRVHDNLSGLDDRTLNLEVDGSFVLMEYDAEAGALFGSPEEPLSPGKHRIILRLRDFCGNEARLERTLTVKGS